MPLGGFLEVAANSVNKSSVNGDLMIRCRVIEVISAHGGTTKLEKFSSPHRTRGLFAANQAKKGNGSLDEAGN